MSMKEPILPVYPKSNVYLIFDRLRGLYKIGQSKSVVHRFKQLKTANAGIELICSYVSQEHYDENWLHNDFEHCHVSGEWFKLGPDELKWFHTFFMATCSEFTNYQIPQ